MASLLRGKDKLPTRLTSTSLLLRTTNLMPHYMRGAAPPAPLVPPEPPAPVIAPEPQITDPNPVPALVLAGRRFREASDNQEQCLCTALGLAFEGAVLASNDPEKRGHISKAWQDLEGKAPRMDNFNSLLRHTVALARSPQKPKAALKDASFYTQAMIDFPHTMRAGEVAENLRVTGIKKRARETAQRRAAQKASVAPATIISEADSAEDQLHSPEPHVGSPTTANVASTGDDVTTTDQPSWVDVTMRAEPDTARLLETVPMGSQVAALISRDATGKLRVEVAPTTNS